MYFADVAGSYTVRRAIEKIQRRVAEKGTFGGRMTIFKHTLTNSTNRFFDEKNNYY